VYRDRIKELKRVRASELLPSPHNWRRHPQQQQDALRSVLSEVGYADAVLVREVPKGYEIVDGHLRTSLDEDQMVPVLVVDLDEHEAKQVLATHDPIGALAETNAEQLSSLLAGLTFDEAAINEMLDAIIKQADRTPGQSDGPTDFPQFDDDIETQYRCPSCQYEWSGEPR
jgi:ParB-like chromosome segregation protein Spo0J